MTTSQILSVFAATAATHFIQGPCGDVPVKELSRASRPDGVWISEVEDAFGERFPERTAKLHPIPRV